MGAWLEQPAVLLYATLGISRAQGAQLQIITGNIIPCALKSNCQRNQIPLSSQAILAPAFVIFCLRKRRQAAQRLWKTGQTLSTFRLRTVIPVVWKGPRLYSLLVGIIYHLPLTQAKPITDLIWFCWKTFRYLDSQLGSEPKWVCFQNAWWLTSRILYLSFENEFTAGKRYRIDSPGKWSPVIRICSVLIICIIVIAAGPNKVTASLC